MKELTSRIIVSLIFIPILIIALWFEGWPLFGTIMLMCVLGTHEYITMMRFKKIMIPWFWLFFAPVIYSLWIFFPDQHGSLIWAALLMSFFLALFSWDESRSVPQLFASLFGVIYAAIIPAMIVSIAWDRPGEKILLALILMIWIVDTVAYFFGMRFGIKRGITQVSPKKSREGFVAGALAPVLVLLILYITGFDAISWPILLLVAVAAGIFGQLGDLLESMLKRYCGVKDSSRLIPGHGGVLDRTDSILLAGAFLYSVLNIIKM